MFHSARLQLTAWYLLIIMIISSLFSFVIYSSINTELVRFEEFQQGRQERLERTLENFDLPKPPKPVFSTEEIQHARQRVILTLVAINGVILLISGGAGYFLAGRTLRPIQDMLDEQKRFVTDASHELRTPLTALRSQIEVSLRDSKLSLKEAKQLLKSNLEEVIELQNLSDGLITLTKQQMVPQHVFSDVTLLAVVESAIKKVTPLLKRKSITINEQLEDGVLHGNRESLTELFVILLDNAIKYSPVKTMITVRSQLTKHTIIIKVVDHGMGIAKKDLTHIFARFYRADEARSKSNTSGYGLGLSIARKIVEEHGGEIAVRSTLGKGTTFTIKFPLTSS